MQVITTIPNSMPGVRLEMAHTLALPSLCPATGNPQAGSELKICYAPAEKLLDVFCLKDVLNEYAGHQEIRDIEYMIQHLAQRIAVTINVEVIIEAVVRLDIEQTLHIKATAIAE